MNVILRRTGLVVASLLLLVALLALGGYVASQRKLGRKFDIAAEAVPIPTDSASISRGRHVARAITKCVECHGENLAGTVMQESGAMGRWPTPNLTSGKGGIGSLMKDADWVRAIRHGVGHDGRPLFLMPSAVFQNLSAGDLGDLVAYVKSLPPVDHELPTLSLGPVARGLMATGKVQFFSVDRIDHAKPPRAAAPPAGPTAEYGAYVVQTGGCMECHGPTLAGGKIDGGDPSWPPAANITPTGLQAYDEAAFITAMRTGVRPGGTQIRPPMPWRWTSEMTDDETRAVWAYLKTVPPREFGAR